VRERVIRDATEHVLTRIKQIGDLVLASKFMRAELRRMDTIPLP
jgi:hypothetical protein